MFQFHCYKQTAPPGLYSFTSGSIRTVVSHKASTGKQGLPMPPQESLNVSRMPVALPVYLHAGRQALARRRKGTCGNHGMFVA